MTAEPWTVEFERRAEKDLERLDPQVKQRVLGAIGRQKFTKALVLSSDEKTSGGCQFFRVS